MEYDDWRTGIQGRPRGHQQWTTRVRVYSAIAAAGDDPSLDARAVCGDVAQSTFYKCFGPTAADRLVVHDDPLLVAVVETKEWTFAGYREGVSAACEQVHPGARVALDAAVRVVSQWSADHVVLATRFPEFPPPSAVTLLADVLAQLPLAGHRSMSSSLAAAVTMEAIQQGTTAGDEGVVANLNAVRARFPDVWAQTDVLHEAAAAATDALVDYVALLADHRSTGRDAPDLLLPLLRRVVRVLEGRTS